MKKKLPKKTTLTLMKLKNEVDINLFIKILKFTFLFGLLIHAYCFLHPSYNHDSLVAYNQFSDITWKISLGRFMQTFSILFRGYVSVPWILGLLSLFYLSIASYFLTKIFSFKNKNSIYLIILILLISAPVIITNAIYTHEADSFMLGFLFATLSVYVYNTFKLGNIISPLLIVASTGFYQAYFSVVIILFLILIIVEILKNPETKYIIHYILKILLNLILGIVLYYIINIIILNLTGIQPLDGYNSINNSFNFINNIGLLFYETYKVFFELFLNPYKFRSVFYITLNSIFLLMLLYMIIGSIRINKISKINIVLLFLLFLILPFACNITYFISGGLVHTLMITSFYMIFILLILLLENQFFAKIKILFLPTIGIYIFLSFLYANNIYNERILSVETTQGNMNRIIYSLENHEDYIPGESKVVFLGNINRMSTSSPRDTVYPIRVISYEITYRSYLDHIMEYNINLIVDNKTINEFEQKNEIKEMSTFPEMGYIQVIDDTFVIKLS